MQKRTELFAAILALVAVTASAEPASHPAGASEPASIDTSITNALDASFEHFRQTAHIPGLVWGIVRDGQLVHVGTFGVQDVETKRPVTPDTVFRIASMSKAFTALAVLGLRDAGKISLDAPVQRYIPQAKGWRYPTTDSPELRVRDLLGHTGGLGPDDPWSDREQPMPETAFTALLDKGLSFNDAPDANYEYSSLGYALLGRIITNVSGQRYDRYIQSLLMRPLGMTASGYEIGDVPLDRLAVGYRCENDLFVREPSMANGAFGAMGGVHTNARDYARWVSFLLSAWPARDGPEGNPVPRALVRELATGMSLPRVSARPRHGDAGPCPFATVYGAGFNIVRDCELGLLLTHNGGYPGYGSTVLLMPDYGVGIFAFANRTYAVPIGVVFDAASALKQAGLLKARVRTVGAALARAYAAAGAMYRAGDVRPGSGMLSSNFLMDRSTENWRDEFTRLKGDVGTCKAQEPIIATGLRTGSFSWACEHGEIRGTLELSPTNPPLIQALRFEAKSLP